MAKKGAPAPKEGKAFKAFRKYVTGLREEQFKELVERTKRRGAAARTRRRFFEKLAKNIGFDISILDDLHAREWESISKPSKKQERAASRLAKLERESQKLALNTINRNRGRFEYRKGNPQTSICRWTATGPPSVTINPQTFNNGSVVVVPPITAVAQVGNNVLRTRVRVQANLSNRAGLFPVAAVDIFSSHIFEAQVPHDGVVSVVTEYSPMGNIFLGAPGDCVFPGESSAEVNLFMFVEIETAAGDVIELPRGTMNTIVDREIEATCDGTNRMIRIGSRNSVAHQLAHNDVIAVDQGDLVRVNAGIEIFLSTAMGGTAEAIFAPAPFGLNIPTVMVKVVS
jgi:hypothetical protein